MSKNCYVIMPYGGNDEERKKRFKSIYSAIIKPAAESKGYTVIREDHEARQGNIGSNIIKSLSEFDLVIADLSENNWNVAYELGIRHALFKSGTILIIDDQTQLMFDIQGNKVITYNYNWYNCIDETQQSIVDSISYIEENRTSSDSPVHDIYTRFPVKLIDYLSDNNDEEKETIAALMEENAKLKETLDNAGLSSDSQIQHSDIASAFRDAMGRSQYSGTKALLKLQESLAVEEDFINFLSNVMSKGFLSENDCNRIYWMCHKLDNYFVTIVFLEEIVKRFPDNEEFSGRLAREYAKNPENRDKAVLAVNKNIGVRKMNNRYVLEKKPMSHNLLASFFDVYITLDKYSELKEIAPLLLDMYPNHSEIIQRNIVTACNGLSDYAEAERIAKELVEKNPSAINHYSLYKVYRYLDYNDLAYEQIEASIIAEPDDYDYYVFMAGFMLDECYIRTHDNFGDSITKCSKMQAANAAIPFIYEAYSNNYDVSECIDFLRKNNLMEAAQLLYSYAKQHITDIPHDDNYDYYPLDVCLGR